MVALAHEPLTPEEALDALWITVRRHQHVSPSRLLELIPLAARAKLDARSRLLIRDSLDALEAYLGSAPFASRLVARLPGDLYRSIREEDHGKVGFPTLRSRLVEPTTPEDVRTFFRELGRHVRRPATVYIAGSISLILPGVLVRSTDDIDVIDEIPAEIREQHDLIDRLQSRTRLRLAHTASHYYPKNWQRRAEYFDQLGELTVYVIDPIDQLVGKLFSRRPKDFDDVVNAWQNIDQVAFRDRLVRFTRQLRAVPSLASPTPGSSTLGSIVDEHWYVLTGEKTLPPLADDAE